MARALSFSLSCELYSDGTPYTIAYSEERSDPELVEQHSPEGSGAVRTFYCAWADRFNFVENMLGFAKINPADTDGITADSPFNGDHIHRKRPFGYNMGMLNGSTPVDWVYATRATIIPDGAKKQNTTHSLPEADYAKVAVTFSALDYDVHYSDLDIVALSTGSGDTYQVKHLKEWYRYGRIVQKPASIFFQYPQQVLKLVDYPTVGQSTPVPQPVNILDNIADFWVYLYDLPYDPIVGVNNCFGHVNKFAFFATPDFPNGQPAESLHLVAADIVRLPLRCGRRYWNLQLGFRKVFNLDYDGTTYRGHNYIRYVHDLNAAVKQLRFYRVASDPANPRATGSAMISLVDYGKLFWPT